MDPDACLARLIDAAITGDVDELIEASTDLAVWLEKGGAAPDDPRSMMSHDAYRAHIAHGAAIALREIEGKVRERINREPHPNETGPTWVALGAMLEQALAAATHFGKPE